MFRTISLFAITALFLLTPARLIAGGPPWLCLPIEGVTFDNAEECGELLTSKLARKLSPYAREYRGVELRKHLDQWYLAFYIGEDVKLREVEAALAGSRFSVPRDKLHLFGHVILEIDARKSTAKDLSANLDALDFVSVAKSEIKDGLLLVTLDMSYPVEDNRRERLSAGWEKFHRNDFASDQSTKSEPAATPGTLPGYNAFRDTLAKHKASLKDVRWSTYYACRPQGGVAVESHTVASSRSRKTSG
jgi:hypothetical protein